MRASELTNTRQLRALRDGDALNGGTPQVWGRSVPTEGKGVSSSWHGGGLEYKPKVDDDDRPARAP